MFEGLYIMHSGVPFLHPVLCAAIALGAVVLASAGRRLASLLSPVIRAFCRLLRFT